LARRNNPETRIQEVLHHALRSTKGCGLSPRCRVNCLPGNATSRTRSWQPRATIGQANNKPHIRKRIMPDLPSGSATFLFTDIEGSTARWERDQVAKTCAVATGWGTQPAGAAGLPPAEEPPPRRPGAGTEPCPGSSGRRRAPPAPAAKPRPRRAPGGGRTSLRRRRRRPVPNRSDQEVRGSPPAGATPVTR
jgi:hypothetical protein